MTVRLKWEERTARKQHICDFCNGTIEKGEKYSYSAYRDGIFFDWKAHNRCDFIAAELWEFADPDEGMASDDFYYACHEFCHVFVCPDCQHFDKEYKECNKDESFCLDRIHALLRTHSLVRSRDKYDVFCFKLAQREQSIVTE